MRVHKLKCFIVKMSSPLIGLVFLILLFSIHLITDMQFENVGHAKISLPPFLVAMSVADSGQMVSFSYAFVFSVSS